MRTAKQKIHQLCCKAEGLAGRDCDDFDTALILAKIEPLKENLTTNEKALLIVWAHMHLGLGGMKVDFRDHELVVAEKMISETISLSAAVISQSRGLLEDILLDYLEGRFDADYE